MATDFGGIAVADPGGVGRFVIAREGSRFGVKDGMRAKIAAVIRAIPSGKVSTYGAIARAAGFPGAARQVVAALRGAAGLPWHRVLGAGGVIKLRGDQAFEQRFRLEAEGVAFRGHKVDMKRHEHKFSKNRKRAASRSC